MGGAAAASSSRLSAAAAAAAGTRARPAATAAPRSDASGGGSSGGNNAASASAASASAAPPSLFQLLAMARCYRTMVSTWMWLPKQLLVGPTLAAGLASRIIKIMIIPRRGGAAVTTTTTATMLATAGILVVLLLLFFRRTMAASASRSSTAKTPMLLSRPRLGVVVVVGAALVWAIYQAAGLSLRPDPDDSSPSPSSTLAETVWTTARASIRCSLAAALLGWTVLGRYMGPRSCHRMSSCLLGACVRACFFTFFSLRSSLPARHLGISFSLAHTIQLFSFFMRLRLP
jgi:hypothetical protein